MRRKPGPWVAALATAALVLSAAPASAHRAQLKSNVFHLSGGQLNGFLVIKPSRGGRIDLSLPAPPPGGKLVIDYRLNGTPIPGVEYPLLSSNQSWPIGITTRDQDKLELNDIRIVDSGGTTVVVLGTDKVTRGRDVLAAPLVWVVDTLSDVGFTRGGDTVINRKGEWSVGFDALRSRSSGERLNNNGNFAEIELSVNDGPWQVHRVTFDVHSGKSRPRGRPGLYVGTKAGDRVRVRRVDVFDSGGRKFATIGIRMGLQGHYVENVPTLAPSPTPTLVPTATPTPTPTPEPTETPGPTQTPDDTPTPDVTPTPDDTPTPDVTPTPDGTPTPEPTPDPTPTPDATPTPDPTPDATPTPDPTPEPTATPDPTPEPTPTPDPTPEPTPTPEETPTPTPEETP